MKEKIKENPFYSLHFWHVYILKCDYKYYYTGFTTNLERRFKEHLQKEVISTKKYKKLEIITYFSFNEKWKAISFEKYLKSGSGRAFAKKRLR